MECRLTDSSGDLFELRSGFLSVPLGDKFVLAEKLREFTEADGDDDSGWDGGEDGGAPPEEVAVDTFVVGGSSDVNSHVVSRDETLHPGEFFGSGTTDGGCGLEQDRYLSDGDVVELEVERIGVLRNRVRR